MSQSLRNALYAVAAVAVLYGKLTEDQAAAWLEVASTVIAFASSVLAWWFSRRKYTVEPAAKHATH